IESSRNLLGSAKALNNWALRWASAALRTAWSDGAQQASSTAGSIVGREFMCLLCTLIDIHRYSWEYFTSTSINLLSGSSDPAGTTRSTNAAQEPREHPDSPAA